MVTRKHNEYTTIKLPKALISKIDIFIRENDEYTSRTDLVKEALRNYFNSQ